MRERYKTDNGLGGPALWIAGTALVASAFSVFAEMRKENVEAENAAWVERRVRASCDWVQHSNDQDVCRENVRVRLASRSN